MILVSTLLRVIDNSGAKIVKCIRVLGVSSRRYAKVGDLIVVSVKEVNPEKKLKKGMIFKAVVVRTKSEVVREGGERIRFADNAVVLLRNDNLPVGSRVIGPVMLELRKKGYMNIISLATVTI